MHSRLVVHFLRRFVQNDLLSPDADRHEVIAMTCAALVTTGGALAVLLSLKYLFRPVQSAGWTAMVALDDIFFYASCSMVVMGLVAVAEWDALGLDARDAAILGPLPVRRAMLARAQATAVIAFAGIFGIAVNLAPAAIAPVLRVSKLPVSILDIVWLVASQAFVTTAAGVFGFMLVFAVREGTRAVLPSAWFTRVSSLLQASLVVLLATSFLLLPSLHFGIARRWIAPATRATVVPPLWFVGLHEAIAGRVLDRLPRTEPPRDAPARLSMIAFETRMTMEYRERKPALAALAELAVIGLAGVLLVSAAAWAWNARRLPTAPLARPAHRGKATRAAVALIERVVVRHPAGRAGYFFTLQTLARSAPHRIAAATTAAGAIAVAAVCLRASLAGGDARQVPLTLFALQTLVLVALATGLRHALSLPANLRTSPVYWLSSCGHDRAFVDGAKRAVFTAAAVPAVAALFALHVVVLGMPAARLHAVSGVLVACILIDAAFAGSSRVPLVSSHVSSGNVLGLAPIYVTLTLAVVFGLAWVERAASSDGDGIWAFWAGLVVVWIAVRWSARPRQNAALVRPDLEEWPDEPTQRLTLSE